MTRNWFALGAAAALFSLSGSTMWGAISDPVKTEDGQISGVTLKSGVRVFKGIPFGAPPVGPLRWREPQPVEHWTGIRKMDHWGDVCIQNHAPNRTPPDISVDLPDSPPMSEDCLYLNVWTGAKKAGAKLPVMVWLYGGAYTEGSGSSPHSDGEALAKKGVIIVTFNYRLGPFGWFSHPELTKESGRNASGNQGLADAIATLEWVKKNIAAFGGNPANVTIFGESAGAAMVGGLVGSPVAKGLFEHAIAESGQWMGLGQGAMTPLARAEQAAAGGGRGRGGRGGRGGFGGRGGRGRGGPGGAPAEGRAAAPAEPPAPRPLPTLAALRARSADEVQKTMRGSGMIIDGYIIPEDESLIFAEGKQNPVDVIIGSNKDEQTAMGGNIAFRDTEVWAARLFCERQTAIGKRAYWYFFTHEPPVAPGGHDMKATHGVDIAYVFNDLAAPRMFPDPSSPKLADASAADHALANMVSSYWVNFAKDGDPNGKGLPEWARFKDPDKGPHILGEPAEAPGPDVLSKYDDSYKTLLERLMAEKQ